MNPTKWKTIKETFSAILDLPEAERTECLARETDEEIRLEVEKLLIAHEKAEGFIDKPILIEQGIAEDHAKDNFIGKQIENYLILERIGTGGMGAVYLAIRQNSDFKQKVALKLIKRGMDSEAIQTRFAIERRILSTLKQPNIAQLLDGGISSEGLPFFVMEFVEGKPLNEFCSENNLSLEARLEIFRRICSAVEHAHKNLIIHRDLKPSNVLVTADGTPKLLDFGIAKLLSDEDSETTATQAKIFTPEYASPEQILGKTVTTATDVYSLGVILYELLTQHRPFETKGKSFEEIVKSVCETEPTAPSSMSDTETQRRGDTEKELEISTNIVASPVRHVSASQLKGDLDNIILKALRKEPAERYGSVQQLSEDIWRFLQGLPVLARPQTIGYRFGKYVKRHKAGVFAAALVLLSLIGGISIATWQAIVASRERARAEKRFDDVRKLANLVLFDYQDEIAKLQGSTPIRERMINDGMAYLDSIFPESNNDKNLQLEIARAYQKIGDIQGNPFQPNLGQVEPALTSYLKSKEITEQLYSENPENLGFLKALAKADMSVGSIYLTKGDFPNALENYRQSSTLYEKLAKNESEYIEALYGLAQVSRYFGFVYSRQGNTEKALESFQDCLAKYQELTAKSPNEKKYQSGLSAAYNKIGDEYFHRNDFQKSLENHQKTFQIDSAILESEPNNVRFKRNTIIGLSRLSKDYLNLNDLPNAFEASKKALAMQSEIADSDKQNMQFRSELGAYHIIHANIQSNIGDAKNAEENALTSIKILDELVEKNPTEGAAKAELGLAYSTTAEIFEKSGKIPETIDFYQKAVTNLDTKEVGGGILDKVADIYEKLGDLTLKLGNPSNKVSESRIYYQKSLDIWQELKQLEKLTDNYKQKPDEVKLKLEKCEKALSKNRK
jgi:eukaryotic-like serine/threonine-protein kinase